MPTTQNHAVSRKRALLIGINAYPDPAARLEGCVNDTFLFSAFLQERGFLPSQIRLLHNHRATCANIKERIHWLFRDAQPGDTLILYFSGHGARIPQYTADEIDHMDESLVPYDFDWDLPATWFTDNAIHDFYAGLTHGVRFFLILDCCHSGDMHRSGSQRVKAIFPPDDIRHRAMQWDASQRVWTERALPPIQENFAPEKQIESAWTGQNRATFRLGRALRKRELTDYQAYEREKQDNQRLAEPFLPAILQACQESELAYEYREGNQSYGTFTWFLLKGLREAPQGDTLTTVFSRLSETLHSLNYFQHPQILAPQTLLQTPVAHLRI